VLTLFWLEHTSVLDHAVVGNHLGKTPSMGRSNLPRGRSNHVGQERRCRGQP
jgi:hypothetical protein